MNLKLATNCYVRKTRKNYYQRCIYCDGELPIGTIAISLHKPLHNSSTNGVNIWIHPRCVKKYFKEIIKKLDKNKNTLVAYGV